MPGPWVAILAALLFTPGQGVPAASQAGVRQVYGDLVVEAKSATFTEDDVTFRDGVRATFAGEVLTADSLILHPKDEKGEATGHVVLIDPSGTLSAEDLQFSWNKASKGGSGRNVHLNLAGVMMDAEKAESIPDKNPKEPNELVFTNVYGTSCAREHVPLYAIRSPQVVFRPGKEGVIRRPILYIYGKRIATLPTHRFSLDPRIHGIPLPGIALGKNKVGLLWAPSFLIDKNTAASINIRSFKKEHLLASAYVSRSYLSAQNSFNLITPHSDLAERFGGSYFDNIRVGTPLAGANSLRSRRDTLSLGSEWNRTSINDPSKAIYSKPIEAIYEMGGPLGPRLGYQYALRAEEIRRNNEGFRARAIGQGSIGPEPMRIASFLYAEPRLDTEVFLGSTSFGWSRAELGLFINPRPWITLGVGYGHGEEFGTPMYRADRLLIRNEGMARLDLDLGPRKFGILEKRDFDRHKWYREYYASQIMGCLEAFVAARQFPRSYQLGVTLRLDDFFRILRSRKVQLNASNTPAATTDHAVHP